MSDSFFKTRSERTNKVIKFEKINLICPLAIMLIF